VLFRSKIASAHVVLRCGLKKDGTLTGCDVISESPSGHGFAQAAQHLAKAFETSVGEKPDDLSRMRVDVPFDFADPSAPRRPPEMYDPLWLRRPDSDTAVRVYPRDAIKAGIKSGRANVVCEVKHDGFLKDCEVVEEEPAGLGFGAAALQLAAVMQMNPWTAQGAPVDGARIELPIKLVQSDQPPAAPSPAAAPPSPTPAKP